MDDTPLRAHTLEIELLIMMKSFPSLQHVEESFTLLSVMATLCLQSRLWADIEWKNGRNNGKTRVGV